MKSYVKAKMLTHDEEQAAAYKADPLIFRRDLRDPYLFSIFRDAGTRLIADADANPPHADAVAFGRK